MAATRDQYVDYARFCGNLHQSDKERSYRQLAGLEAYIPAESDLRHFRDRVGAGAIHATMASMVELFRAFGLIKGKLLSTNGQLRSDSRCHHLTITLSHFNYLGDIL